MLCVSVKWWWLQWRRPPFRFRLVANSIDSRWVIFLYRAVYLDQLLSHCLFAVCTIPLPQLYCRLSGHHCLGFLEMLLLYLLVTHQWYWLFGLLVGHLRCSGVILPFFGPWTMRLCRGQCRYQCVFWLVRWVDCSLSLLYVPKWGTVLGYLPS